MTYNVSSGVLNSTSVIFVNENENGENEKITHSLTKTKTQKWWILKRN